MKPRNTLLVLAAGLAVLSPRSTRAAPLNVFDLDLMTDVITCREACAESYETGTTSCLSTCPVPPSDKEDDWEKNALAPVNRLDLELAAMEYWDAGRGEAVCTYEETGAVRPYAACEAIRACESDELGSSADCADWDGDGIVARFDIDDETYNAPCIDNTDCGFEQTCETNTLAAASVCEPRACDPERGCTAFHLETVAADSSELIVHVYYDFSPGGEDGTGGVTMLDLRIEYTDSVLTLVDSRPLAALRDVPSDPESRQKELITRHVAPGLVRLIVMDRSVNQEPIRYGPIVELVFTRHSGSTQASVHFSRSARDRERSLAPRQGMAQQELSEDGLWGEDVVLAATVKGQGDRLVLHYTFDAPTDPLAHTDIPNAEELCHLVRGRACSAEDIEDRSTISRLRALQEGTARAPGAIDGVWRDGASFDGNDDHVALPLTFTSADIEELVGTSENGPNPQRKNLSLSAWVMPEGSDELRESPAEPQILFAHTVFDTFAESPKPNWGLMLRPTAEVAELVWFEGDVTSVTGGITKSVTELPLRMWSHVGLSVSAEDDPDGVPRVRVFVDGVAMDDVAINPPWKLLSCPVPPDVVGNPLALSLMNEQTTLYSARRRNLFGLDAVAAGGGAIRSVLRDQASNYRDPDYSAITDKVVFSSNEDGGNYEIWLANRDGTDRFPITVGFGDARRGIEARRPRWSPDGSAIVFESNVYDLSTGHNSRSLGYQLYLIGFNPDTGAPAARLSSDSAPISFFSYDAALANGRPDEYAYWRLPNQLTGHGESARWQTVRGLWELRSDLDLSDTLGTAFGYGLIATQADRDFREQRVIQIDVPTEPWEAISSIRDYSGLGIEGEAVQALAVDDRSGRILLQALDTFTTPHTSYETTVTVEPDEVLVDVVYTGYDPAQCPPPPFGATGEDDPEARCGARRIDDLLVIVPTGSVALDRNASGLIKSETVLDEKSLFLDVRGQGAGREVAVMVRDDGLDPQQFVPGMVVARLVFSIVDGHSVTTEGFNARMSRRSGRLFLVDPPPVAENVALPLDDLGLQRATAAAFGVMPDDPEDTVGLVLAGSISGRPVLVRIALDGDPRPIRLDESYDRTAGVDWDTWETYAPCNWIAGVRGHAGIVQAFRGALDEVRIYNYVRPEAAFRSEAERGYEALKQEGRDGLVNSHQRRCADADGQPSHAMCPRGQTCQCPPGVDCADEPRALGCATSCVSRDGVPSHAACPAYHLCLCPSGIDCAAQPSAHRCEMRSCSPDTPDDCGGLGQCTLLPQTIAPQLSTPDQAWTGWVCHTDCSADSDCRTEACLNGPCGYCDVPAGVCGECRPAMTEGPLPQPTIVGCPDSNGYRCEDGACVTACYSTEYGETRFVCDPALEACHHGECVSRPWQWEDITPATWSGSGSTRFGDDERVGSIDQRVTVQFNAYGVGDYGRSPEVLVEGCVSDTSGGSTQCTSWKRLGKVSVHNRNPIEAYARPYRVTARHPRSLDRHDEERPATIRLRLVSTPVATMAAGMPYVATGIVGRALKTIGDTSDTWSHELICEPDQEGLLNGPACAPRAPGSGANVGYPVSLAVLDLEQACAPGDDGCLTQISHLRTGRPSVIILNPTSIRPYGVPPEEVSNAICPYESRYAEDEAQPCPLDDNDRPTPCGLGGRRKRLNFGSVYNEVSNEAAHCRMQQACFGTVVLATHPASAPGGFGVLNCPYYAVEQVEGSSVTHAAGLVLRYPESALALDGTPTHMLETGVEVAENHHAGTCTFTTRNVRVSGEVSYVTKPCYAWYGGDATLDGANAPAMAYHLLDIDRFSTFGRPNASDGKVPGTSLPPGSTCPDFADRDGDGVCGARDNCPEVANPDQSDRNANGVGDACDACCPAADAADCDRDEAIEPRCICDIDSDADGICDLVDNCRLVSNILQRDSEEPDGDGVGDACDACPDDDGVIDLDGDFWCRSDNCPAVHNSDQLDSDGDGLGDACDPCPEQPGAHDPDNDGVCGPHDNCPEVSNEDQTDTDGDGLGDVCDPCPVGADADNDKVCDIVDNCVGTYNPVREADGTQLDSDQDYVGDACDTCKYSISNDTDGDGVCDPPLTGCGDCDGIEVDNCPGQSNPNQRDRDGDGIGDLCDTCPSDPGNDPDRDGVCSQQDSCPEVYNPAQGPDDPPEPDDDGDGVPNLCDD